MISDTSGLEEMKGVSVSCAFVLSLCNSDFLFLLAFLSSRFGLSYFGNWGFEKCVLGTGFWKIAEDFGLIFDQRAMETVCGKWVM